MGNTSGGDGQKGVEAMLDSLWAKMLSRGMSILGWPLLGFVAFQLWTTGTEMVTAQRELASEVRYLSKDVNKHEERLNDLERRERRASRPDRETP